MTLRCDQFSRSHACALITGLLVYGSSLASCANSKSLIGVNLAGAEYNADKLPGEIFKDYLYPDPAEIRHFRSLGMNTFRLPVRWERVQPQLSSELNKEELHRISDVVRTVHELDGCVILDIHNYGEYRGSPIGSDKVSIAAYIDLWQRLLKAFPSATDVAFDLMNEPSKLPVNDWEKIAQQAVDTLRKDGSKHLLLVAGGRWSGAHDWSEAQGGVSNAEAFRSFNDPGRNSAIEVHQYPDDNFSGTGTSCVDPDKLKTIMANVTQWGLTTGHHLFLGEFGAPSSAQCMQALDALQAATSNSAVWRGSTYWAAGKWWGSYPYSIEPDGETDKPQMAVLKKYLPPNN